jgi:hypothetical protein
MEWYDNGPSADGRLYPDLSGYSNSKLANVMHFLSAMLNFKIEQQSNKMLTTTYVVPLSSLVPWSRLVHEKKKRMKSLSRTQLFNIQPCVYFFSIKNYKVVHEKPFDSSLQDQFCVDRKSKMAEMFKNIKWVTRSKSRKKGYVTLTNEFLFRTFILQMLKLVKNIHIHDVHIQK